MRTSLLGSHLTAPFAIKGGVEKDGSYTEFSRVELQEFFLRVVWTIEIAHAGVVASHNEMCTAIVLAGDGVEDCLPRTCIPHGRRIEAKHGAMDGQVIPHQTQVAPETHLGRYVLPAGLTHQGMQQQPVHDFERASQDIFMGAVDRVARLESDDRVPPTVLEQETSLSWV